MHVHTQASSHNRTHIRSPGLCVRDTHVGNVLLVNVCNSSQTSDARAVSVLWIAPAFLVSLLAFVFFYQSLPVVLSRTESVVCVCVAPFVQMLMRRMRALLQRVSTPALHVLAPPIGAREWSARHTMAAESSETTRRKGSDDHLRERMDCGGHVAYASCQVCNFMVCWCYRIVCRGFLQETEL